MCAMPSDRNAAGTDPQDLERRADEIRADMDRTLGALERKFAPDQLIDRSLGYLREHGGELRQTIGATMRTNPLPIALTLAGITWLVATSYNRRQPPGYDLRSRFARSRVGQKLDDTAARAREHWRSAAEAARERFDSLSAESDSSYDDEYVSGEFGTRTRRGGHLSERLHAATDSARQRAHYAQERVYSMIDEQPFVAGALAVAVGALIGTLLPATQYENRVLGTARDRTLSKAQALGEEQYEHVRDALKSESEGGETSTRSPGTTPNSPLSGRA